MRQISRYIDEARNSGIIQNDADLARKIGIGRAAVSLWRSGERAPNENQAAALADLFGKPEIMAEAMATRAKSDKARTMWERVAVALNKCTTFGVLAAVGLIASPPPAEASAQPVQAQASRLHTLYYVN